MKLKSYLLAGLAIFAMTACNEDFADWKEQAQNTQPKIVEFGEGSVAAVDLIDFAEIPEGTEFVKVCEITPPTTTIEESKLSYTISLDGTDFNLNNDGTMSYPDFKAFVETTYGKAPNENEIPSVVKAYIGNDISTVRFTSNTFIVKAKPDSPFIDEGGYYLVGDFYKTSDEHSGWDKEGAHKFSQIGSGNVYDNPEFSITFEVTNADSYWKIIPANNYEGDFWKEGKDGVVGTNENGDPSLEGALTTSSPQAGRIKEPGLYKMTINMMDYKFTIEAVNYATYIWQAGNANEWGSPANPLVLTNDDLGTYEGFMYLNGGFKFRSQETNWNAPDWGYGGSPGTLKPQAGDLTADEGFYAAKVVLSALTFELTPITTVGIIGSATENGWDASTPMDWDSTEKCWVITTTLKGGAGFEMKFRGNDDWADATGNWGGSWDNIINGSNTNLPVEQSGTATIKFYPTCNGKSYATITYID